MSQKNASRLAVLAACDVWMADQRGCLSPVTVYAQKGGQVTPPAFARLLAAELEKRQKKEKTPPRRTLSDGVAAHGLHSRHLLQKIRGGVSVFWESRPRGLWAVAYEEGLRPSMGASSQSIIVKGFRRTTQVLSALKPVKKYLQCIALECAPGERQKIAEALSALGVNRICRAGKMQRPPATWHHDGKPNLASWIRWTDLE